MGIRITTPTRWLIHVPVLALAASLSLRSQAQTNVLPASQSDTTAVPAKGTVLDQVVAVVNGDLVLESDMDEERRFQNFQPFRDLSQPYSREKTVERLIDRTLILQQEKLQPQPAFTDADVNSQFATLRKDIPACKEYACETDAGWNKFVADQGFTMSELTERWRERMEVLRFIEQRFKMGIRITPEQIKSYYDTTLLPAYTKRKATPPKLATISDRIQEILLQQQVGALLEDWLTSLKAQGTVRVVKPGEVEP
jgi:peptidyl-prolyl cis-trans isomerase SurA